MLTYNPATGNYESERLIVNGDVFAESVQAYLREMFFVASEVDATDAQLAEAREFTSREDGWDYPKYRREED